MCDLSLTDGEDDVAASALFSMGKKESLIALMNDCIVNFEISESAMELFELYI